MRALSLITLTLVFLLFPSFAIGATFSITNPSPGVCFTPGQSVNITWGQTSAPASNHYAVTYNTNGATPSPYSSSPGSWVLGHDFGGIGTTNRSWTVPNISSTTVRVWVEAHKNNHDQTEIVGSGYFSIKSSCSVSPPPPPPPPAKPPATPPPSPPPAVDPTPPPSTEEPPPASENPEENNDTEEENSKERAEAQEKTKTTDPEKKKSLFQIPQWVGMVYLSIIGVLSFGGIAYLLSRTKIKEVVRDLVKRKPERKLPIAPLKKLVDQPKPKAPVVEIVEKKKPIKTEIKDDLTLADLEKLRDQEDIK